MDVMMNAEPDADANILRLSPMSDSEDSEEETKQEALPDRSWNELSIIERVGLNSVEMSEKDLETAFCQIALAFRCDRYTLRQRLQAEEHARNLAEENIQLELARGKETLETLKGLCLDSERSKILQRLELSLDILSGTVERIFNTAEVLGAVHQEARVSRAVELMVAHVDNLRRRHDRHVAALDEAKKIIQQQNSWTTDPRASPDPEESESRKRSSQQSSMRRRISISLISSSTQETKMQTLRKQASQGEMSSPKSYPSCPSPSLSSETNCLAMTKDDSCSVDNRPLDAEIPPAQVPPDAPPIPNPERPPSKQHGTTKKMRNTISPLDTLRHRRKGKSVLSKPKADKKSTNTYRRMSAGTYGSLWRNRPLARWLYHCRWALLCMYLFVLLCVVTLTYYLWKLHNEALDP